MLHKFSEQNNFLLKIKIHVEHHKKNSRMNRMNNNVITKKYLCRILNILLILINQIIQY